MSLRRAATPSCRGATPAFVREWGEPVRSLTPAQYASLETELLAIERRERWIVQDALLVFARPDGTVFVGDVGYWHAPGDLDARPRNNVGDLLRVLLRDVPVRRPDGEEWRPKVLPELERLARLAGDERDNKVEYGRSALDSFLRRQFSDLAAEVRWRYALGMPVPDEVRFGATLALEFLRR